MVWLGEGGKREVSFCRGRRNWTMAAKLVLLFPISIASRVARRPCHASRVLLLARQHAKHAPVALWRLTRCIQYRMNDMMRRERRRGEVFLLLDEKMEGRVFFSSLYSLLFTFRFLLKKSTLPTLLLTAPRERPRALFSEPLEEHTQSTQSE